MKPLSWPVVNRTAGDPDVAVGLRGSYRDSGEALGVKTEAQEGLSLCSDDGVSACGLWDSESGRLCPEGSPESGGGKLGTAALRDVPEPGEPPSLDSRHPLHVTLSCASSTF